MPIHCSIAFPILSETEMAAIDYQVMGFAFEIHNRLGCLCDESVYKVHFAEILNAAGFQTVCELPILMSFRSFFKTLYLDLVVNQSVIYELKTVEKLTKAHVSQLLNYLFLTDSARGKLINFRSRSVESKFVNSTFEPLERRRFAITKTGWAGPSDLLNTIVELVMDWGTGLDQSLYTEAIFHFLGGTDTVNHQLPMQIEGRSVGKQRFHLLDGKTAVRITTYQYPSIDHYRTSLHKLLVPSPLACIHWVNIA